jgi:putative addiction module component (TIGR02574 family)
MEEILMNTLARSDVLKLTLDERLRLVEDIWDSIVECPDVISLTDAQKIELERRLDEYHDHPDTGSPWSSVRDKFQKR